MGSLRHEDLGPLHGLTVVVETAGPEVYIGRCHRIDGNRVLLLDADVHRDGAGGRSTADYIATAARDGFWKTIDRVEVPSHTVRTIRRLDEIEVP